MLYLLKKLMYMEYKKPRGGTYFKQILFSYFLWFQNLLFMIVITICQTLQATFEGQITYGKQMTSQALYQLSLSLSNELSNSC